MAITAATFAAAQAGEPAALEQLLRQLQPDARRYARYQCHRGSAIEDVVQEALIIIYRRVGTVRDVAALGGWMFKVIARLCMLPALAVMRGTEEISLHDEGKYFAHIGQDELRIDLVRALESLPLDLREVIVLRDMQQLTITEIADRLQLTRPAAKSRIHRARAMVREYLRPAVAAGVGAGAAP